MTHSLRIAIVSAVFVAAIVSPRIGQAQTATGLYSFHGSPNAASPYSGVISDTAGNLYGLTFGGGSSSCLGGGCGSLYKLTLNGGTYTESEIHPFLDGPIDGSVPQGPSLSFGPDGDLYGTTYGGGSSNCIPGCGTVFRFVPSGSSWTEEILYRFTGGNDGSEPFGGVVFDKQGNLYGTASSGGYNYAGTVFELTPSSTGWTFKVIYDFPGVNYDLASASGTLVWDQSGNLYGEASDGGLYQGGGIFELTPDGTGWMGKTIYNFCALPSCADGGTPYGGLAVYNGKLFGFANSGGIRNCYGGLDFCGLAFELSPTSTGWKDTVLYNFTGGADGGVPFDGPVIDRSGNLYGTTYFGGANDAGAVVRISPSASGWTETAIFSFDGGASGRAPSASLLLMNGSIYGTAVGGGTYGLGTVFQLKP